VALLPNSRAGITRVSLNTSRSPGCNSDGKSRTPRSANAASPGGTSSRRLAERSGNGACAISACGSS
jgi:hypothetical protein